jgi:hypothetical protein
MRATKASRGSPGALSSHEKLVKRHLLSRIEKQLAILPTIRPEIEPVAYFFLGKLLAVESPPDVRLSE